MTQDPDLADLLNLGETFRYALPDGTEKTVCFRELTIEQKARFAQRLKDQALAAVTAGAAAGAPEHVRNALLDRYLIQVAAGVYEFGGEASVQALTTHAGQAYAIYLMAVADDPTFTEMQAAALLQDRYNEIAKKILEKSAPKSAGPADSAGPTSCDSSSTAAEATSKSPG